MRRFLTLLLAAALVLGTAGCGANAPTDGETAAVISGEAQPPEPAVPQRHGAVQIILNGSPVLLPAKPDGTPNLFFDVLNYVAIDPDHPQGEPVIRRNDRAASYIEPIHDGDRIEVYWG